MPYDTQAVVAHKGRMVTESVAPGAFYGIEARTERVRVNRDHDYQRTIGRALWFDSRDPRGLVAGLRIARTRWVTRRWRSQRTAAWTPAPGRRRTMESRSHRRLTRLHLDHIAMTTDPAYQSARVLAVRSS